jgi:hypothetical protein
MTHLLQAKTKLSLCLFWMGLLSAIALPHQPCWLEFNYRGDQEGCHFWPVCTNSYPGETSVFRVVRRDDQLAINCDGKFFTTPVTAHGVEIKVGVVRFTDQESYFNAVHSRKLDIECEPHNTGPWSCSKFTPRNQ